MNEQAATLRRQDKMLGPVWLRGEHVGRRRVGFTLLEVVIVLAVTAVIFGLLLRPILSSLNLTQQAQSLAAAQDSGRKAVEVLSRELSHANYVFSGLSHPFTLQSPPASSEDTYTDFLDIEIPAQGSVLPAPHNNYTVAHVYGAKLDFALAQPNSAGTGAVTDPTSLQKVTIGSTATGGLSEQTAPALLPLAPNTTLVRYFVGLQAPIVSGGQGHYDNDNIGITKQGEPKNTYVLYRAQVNVYAVNSKGQTVPDPRYFATVAESKGDTSSTPTVAADSATPELDDPDFFRFVNDADIDWLDPTHASYTGSAAELNTSYDPSYGSETDAHNKRVENWMLIAKPVVSAPQIDLLNLPHDSDGTIHYDTNGIACNSYVDDGVQGATGNADISGKPATWPIATVSVSFTPTAYAADSPSPTAAQDLAQGFSNNPASTGLAYIPSAYQSSHLSWSPNYSIELFPYGYNSNLPGVQQGSYFVTSQTFVAIGFDNPGDMIEYRVDAGASGSTTTSVYNVTQGKPEPGALGNPNTQLYNYYVPFTIDADRGYINFAIPAVPPLLSAQTAPTALWPTGQYSFANPNNPFYVFAPTGGTSPIDLGTAVTNTANGSKLETVLPSWSTGAYIPGNKVQFTPPAGIQIQNAMIVPGSLHFLGPDSLAGPNNGYSTQYQVLPAAAPTTVTAPTPSTNQAQVMYTWNAIAYPSFTVTTNPNPDPLALSFSYQANLTLQQPTYPPAPEFPNAGAAPTPGNYGYPMTVAASYASRDAINASIGIRVYRPSSSQSDLAVYPATIAVGNANH